MERITGHQKIPCPSLFRPLQVGGIRLKNRVVVLPVHTGYAYPDGRVSPLLMKFYERLAASGAGMVVVANAAVSKDGKVSRFNLRADSDDFIPGLAELAAGIKKNGAISCLQLNHAGRFAKTQRPLLPSPITGSNLNFNMNSLKQFMEFFPFEKRFSLTRSLIGQINSWFQAMDDQDIARVIDDFSRAAFRACQAGFDMVELHGANGYLLCQFLSRFTNRLKSGFGGSFEARMNFPVAVLNAVRQRLPVGFPVGFRLLLEEWVPDGIDLAEALAFAKRLETEGITYLSASVATYNSMFTDAAMTRMSGEAYLCDAVDELTSRAGVPTIISGRILKPETAEAIVRENIADLVGLGRPIRTDPDWIKKASGKPGKIITCLNCNWCIRRVILEEGFECTRWPRRLREQTWLAHKLLNRSSATLLVIAGKDDAGCFKQIHPAWLRDSGDDTQPAVLLLQEKKTDMSCPEEKAALEQWLREEVCIPADSDGKISILTATPGMAPKKAVGEAIGKGGYGRVLVAGTPEYPWHESLIHGERGKVIGFLKPSQRLEKVIVPVDLSPATLMILNFLKRTILKYPEFEITAVHVLSGRHGTARGRWREMTVIAGVDLADSLILLPMSNDVASTLTQAIRDRNYGTVVMGKRGLSGIKRWLAGSVSTRVFRDLNDQTIFLVD